MQCIINQTNSSFAFCHRVCVLNLKAQVPINFKLLYPKSPLCMKEKDKIHYKPRSLTKIWVGFVGGSCRIFKCFQMFAPFCTFFAIFCDQKSGNKMSYTKFTTLLDLDQQSELEVINC